MFVKICILYVKFSKLYAKPKKNKPVNALCLYINAIYCKLQCQEFITVQTLLPEHLKCVFLN